MKRFLKTSMALAALMLGMASCSSDEPVVGVTPDPIGPGVEAPQFTGIDKSTADGMADGKIHATMVKTADYLRVPFGTTGNFTWHKTSTDNPDKLCVKGGKMYEPYWDYAMAYATEKFDKKALAAMSDLNVYWMRSYRGEAEQLRPEMMCATDFSFASLPAVNWNGEAIEVVQLNADSFAFGMAPNADKQVKFSVYGVTKSVDMTLTLVETPEEGLKLMLDRCRKHYTGDDLKMVEEIAGDLGI